MRNADGQTHRLTDLLTTRRMLAAKEQRAKDLTVACQTIGDTRNHVEARRDLASIRRVERALAGAA